MGIIKQKGAPTRYTAGGVGSILIDTNSYKQYVCTFAYCSNGVWEYEWRETGVIEKAIPVKVEVKTEDKVDTPVEEKVEEKVEEPTRNRQPKRTNYTQYSKKSK